MNANQFDDDFDDDFDDEHSWHFEAGGWKAAAIIIPILLSPFIFYAVGLWSGITFF